MTVVKNDVSCCCGALQVCAGQEGRCEAAVHAMRTIFQSADTDCVLLVDVTNAFNSLNRQAALHNARLLRPVISTALINTYRNDVKMFVVGGEIISSVEGTTQEDPLAMSMYAIGTLPLITSISGFCKQVWFADDATGAGSVASVKKWWDAITEFGPLFGYHANASKTWLITKEETATEAQLLFQDTDVRITTSGKRHLGAAIGSHSFVEKFVGEKVGEWVRQVMKLSEIAVTQPHAAYAAFTHGLSHRWLYLVRTVQDISTLLTPLSDAINYHFIPALTGQAACSKKLRALLGLPCRMGGLNIHDPSIACLLSNIQHLVE